MSHFRSLIMGAPGTGKGTISKFICRDFKLSYLSVGDLLRSHIEANTDIGIEAKAYINNGKLVHDETVNKLVISELNKINTQNWLLDGFPRTLVQAQHLSKHVTLSSVIYLNVPFEEIINRVKYRWIHLSSGRIYNLQFNPPKVSGKDDVTGEPLTQRDDDKENVVVKRLNEYEKQTEPLINYYREKGILREFIGKESNEIYPRIKTFLNDNYQFK